MNKLIILFLFLLPISSYSASFGDLASLDESKIDENARKYLGSEYPQIDVTKLVLFGISLNYSKLIKGSAVLEVTFIDLGNKNTGKPVTREVASLNSPQQKTESVFTEYHTIKVLFSQEGQILQSSQYVDLFPDPPEQFRAVVSEL